MISGFLEWGCCARTQTDSSRGRGGSSPACLPGTDLLSEVPRSLKYYRNSSHPIPEIHSNLISLKNYYNCAWVAQPQTKPSANSPLTRPDRGSPSAQEKRKNITPFFRNVGESINRALNVETGYKKHYRGRLLHLPPPNAAPN